MRVGSQVGSGRTADIYAFGRGSVIKLLRADVPSHWIDTEFLISSAVASLDVPCPRPLELVKVDGQPGIVFERVDGQSMWDHVRLGAMSVEAAARQLADVHATILATKAPVGVPRLAVRLREKVLLVDQVDQDERELAQQLIAAIPDGRFLLHGDLHPGNVLLADDGPMVIDWFDASAGPLMADVARSSILMRSPNTELGVTDASPEAAVAHLPGATAAMLDQLRHGYLDTVSQRIGASDFDQGLLADCEALVALGRVSEQADPDAEPLLRIWRSRPRLSDADR